MHNIRQNYKTIMKHRINKPQQLINLLKCPWGMNLQVMKVERVNQG